MKIYKSKTFWIVNEKQELTRNIEGQYKEPILESK